MKSNFIDRAISFVSPSAGLARARARAAENVFADRQRRYEGAAMGRQTSDWKTTGASANTEISAAAMTLRNRMRDLVRNNPYAEKAQNVYAGNVVGSGIKPSIKFEGGKRYLTATKKAWKDWAETTACDWDGQKTFAAIQEMVIRAIFESGECFVRERRDPKAKIPMKLQVLEADHLDIWKDGISTQGGGHIMQGIEFDSTGRRVAYWLFPNHPGEIRIYKSLMSVRIPAEEILHVYYAKRPGQVRGVPIGVASMLKVKDLDDYAYAELMRKKVQACYTAFVSNASADPLLPGEQLNRLERMEPGAIDYLAPGETVQLSAPPASGGYTEYSGEVLHAIAAGFGITYEALTGDFSGVNFSSGRMGWIEMGKNMAIYQEKVLIPVLCQGVWAWFVRAGTVVGVAKMDISATWTPPGRQMIDPVKETKALSEQVRNGFTSWQDVARQQGEDPDELLEELKADYEMFEKYGFMLACDPKYDTNRVNPANSPPGTPSE